MTDLERAFNERYAPQIAGIAKEAGVDLSVGGEMFKTNIENVGTDGKIYGGGGVLDFAEATKDYEDLLKGDDDDDGGGYKPPQFNYNALSQEEAQTQAGIFVKPQIKLAKNALLERIYGQFKDLPQQLATRGQMTGGQRDLAQQNLTTEQAFGMANIGLQGQQLEQEYAQGLLDTDAQKQSQARREYDIDVDRAYSSYMDELNLGLQAEQTQYSRGLQAEQTQYNKTQDELDRMTKAEQTEYNKQRDLISDKQWQATQNRLASGGGGTTPPTFNADDYQGQIEDNIKLINNDDNVPIDQKNQAIANYMRDYIKQLRDSGVDEVTLRAIMALNGITDQTSATYDYSQGQREGGR